MENNSNYVNVDWTRWAPPTGTSTTCPITHPHTHESCGCQHNCLHYCKICDLVYCCSCNRTFGSKYNSWVTYTNVETGETGTTCNSSAGDCSHNHKSE